MGADTRKEERGSTKGQALHYNSKFFYEDTLQLLHITLENPVACLEQCYKFYTPPLSTFLFYGRGRHAFLSNF